MTYAVPAVTVHADTLSVAPVSLAFAVIRYHVVICEGSVEPKPMRAPIATLFVLKKVPVPVTAVQDTATVPVLSFFTSILKSRTVCAVAVARVIVINHFQDRVPVFLLSSHNATLRVAAAATEFSTQKI